MMLITYNQKQKGQKQKKPMLSSTRSWQGDALSALIAPSSKDGQTRSF